MVDFLVEGLSRCGVNDYASAIDALSALLPADDNRLKVVVQRYVVVSSGQTESRVAVAGALKASNFPDG